MEMEAEGVLELTSYHTSFQGYDDFMKAPPFSLQTPTKSLICKVQFNYYLLGTMITSQSKYYFLLCVSAVPGMNLVLHHDGV